MRRRSKVGTVRVVGPRGGVRHLPRTEIEATDGRVSRILYRAGAEILAFGARRLDTGQMEVFPIGGRERPIGRVEIGAGDLARVDALITAWMAIEAPPEAAPRPDPPIRWNPPRGFDENPRSGELICPHRELCVCDKCAAAHPEIVDVCGSHFWIADPADRRMVRGPAPEEPRGLEGSTDA